MRRVRAPGRARGVRGVRGPARAGAVRDRARLPPLCGAVPAAVFCRAVSQRGGGVAHPAAPLIQTRLHPVGSAAASLPRSGCFGVTAANCHQSLMHLEFSKNRHEGGCFLL